MKKIVGLIMSGFLLLSACSSNAVEETEENPQNEVETTVADLSTLDGEYYRPLLRDGVYLPSESRGATYRLNSQANMKAFEKGLTDVSRHYFSTTDHLVEEGQYIESETATSWLGRQSSRNPDGLNPEEANTRNFEDRNPILLETILEQDYYLETENGPKLAGLVIGLGMNSVDYYQREDFGPYFTEEIPRETLIEESQVMADKILKRLRENPDLKDIPIVFGIYEQAPRDDIAGGVYILSGTSTADTVDEWEEISHRKEVLPYENEESNVGQAFDSFRSNVETFMPNLSAVTGVAEYQDDSVHRLVVEISAHVYGEGELIALSQYVQNQAETVLPSDFPIEITIRSLNGVEAFLYSQPGEPVKGYIFN